MTFLQYWTFQLMTVVYILFKFLILNWSIVDIQIMLYFCLCKHYWIFSIVACNFQCRVLFLVFPPGVCYFYVIFNIYLMLLLMIEDPLLWYLRIGKQIYFMYLFFTLKLLKVTFNNFTYWKLEGERKYTYSFKMLIFYSFLLVLWRNRAVRIFFL